MTVLNIRLYPDPVLSTAGKDVAAVDADLLGLIDDMAATMYAAKGVGLAAQQVGDLRRVAVIDVRNEDGDRDKPGKLVELINPKIVDRKGEIKWEEGCLSFPDLYENIYRSNWVRRSIAGAPFTIQGEGLLAVVLQHEIDHLDGVLFTDRMSRLKRRFALKRYKRILEERGEDAVVKALEEVL
jgi:peptide deformylase